MKHFKIVLSAILIIVLMSITIDGFSQRVGINTSTPDSSAALDITSIDKGVLFPRVSLNSVNSTTPVTNPAVGLMVYNTNASITGGDGEGFYYYNGTQWTKLITTAAIDSNWTKVGNDLFNANTGNVGIGTTNASNTLSIGGSWFDTKPVLGLYSGNGNNQFNDGAQISFGYNGTATYQHFIHTRHNGGGDTLNAIDFFVSDGTQNNTLTSGSSHSITLASGRVGIGTTFPSAPLHVAGNSLFEGIINTQRNWISGDGDAEGIAIDNDGSVGIGANPPLAKFHVQQTGTNILSGMRFSSAVLTGGLRDDWFIYMDAQNNLIFREDSKTAMILDDSLGYVGIGSTSPTANLHVGGTFRLDDGSQSNGYVLTTDANGNATWAAPPATGTDSQTLSIFGDSLSISNGNKVSLAGLSDKNWALNGSNELYNTNNSYVGIGTNNPNEDLHLADTDPNSNKYTSLRIENTDPEKGSNLYFDTDNGQVQMGMNGSNHSSAPKAFFISSSNGNPMRFLVGGTDRLYINGSGNVGISTNNPQASFHINGSFRFTNGPVQNGYILTSNASGDAYWAAPPVAADSQTLSIFGDSLSISNGNKVSLAGLTDKNWALNGANELYNTNSGYVGIGTNNPGEDLHVADTDPASNKYTTIRIENSDPDKGSNLYFHTDAGSVQMGMNGSAHSASKAFFLTTPNSPMRFMIGNTDRLYINSIGNVGISTNNPQASFHINGSFRFTNGPVQNGYILTSNASGDAYWAAPPVAADSQTLSIFGDSLSISNGNKVSLAGLTDKNWALNGANELYNTNSGYVGIGTNNPGEDLHVADTDPASNKYTTIRIENSDPDKGSNLYFHTDAGSVQMGMNGSAHSASKAFFLTTPSSPMRFMIGNTDRLYINSNGNVGISTNDPQANLHVNGSLRIANGSQQNGYVLGSDASGNATWVHPASLGVGTNWGTNGTDIYNNNSGNVGIGTTTPDAQLHVAGISDWEGAVMIDDYELKFLNAGQAHWSIFNDASTGKFQINNTSSNWVPGTVGNNALTISTTGNVGLGTIDPQSTLHVDGSFRLEDGTQTNGYVLTSDANGNASWQAPIADNQTLSLSGNNLSIANGNTVSLSSINTDNQTLSLSGTNLSINNGNTVSLSSLVDDGDWTLNGGNLYNANSGNVGIGTPSPSAKLDVVGTMQYVDGNQATGNVLTSDGSGNARWKDSGPFTAYTTYGLYDDTDTWRNPATTTSFYAAVGDKVTIHVTASVRLTGGSGTDDFEYYCTISGSGCTTLTGYTTSVRPAESSSDHDNFISIAYQEFKTISCAGTYNVRFYIRNTGDDAWEFQDVNVIVYNH